MKAYALAMAMSLTSFASDPGAGWQHGLVTDDGQPLARVWFRSPMGAVLELTADGDTLVVRRVIGDVEVWGDTLLFRTQVGHLEVLRYTPRVTATRPVQEGER